MWSLVFISLLGEPYMEVVDTYDSMYECFQGRDDILVTLESCNGHFPPGMQSVCILTEK